MEETYYFGACLSFDNLNGFSFLHLVCGYLPFLFDSDLF